MRDWVSFVLMLCSGHTASALLGKHTPTLGPWKQVTFAQDWLGPRAQSRMTFDPYPLTQCLVCLGLRQQLSAPWSLRPYVPILWGALEKGTDLRVSNRGYCPAQERPLTTEALLCKP